MFDSMESSILRAGFASMHGRAITIASLILVEVSPSHFNPCVHRNTGSTFRMAFNDWDLLDVPNYWVLDEYIFVTATVDADGIWSIYKDGEMVSNQYVAVVRKLPGPWCPIILSQNPIGSGPNRTPM